MYVKRQMNPNVKNRVKRNFDLFLSNNANSGFLEGRSNTNPDSGSLTTTPFPRITMFNDDRDETLIRHINIALPTLDDIISLYVSNNMLTYDHII